MKSKLFMTIAVSVLMVTQSMLAEDLKWRSSMSDISDKNFMCVEPDPFKPNIVYAGASNGLYKTSDGGLVWRQIFISTGQYKGLNRVYITKDNIIFIAARNGLFASYDLGETWRNIFRGKGKENDILCIAENPIVKEVFLIGTARGLFISRNSGKTWKKFSKPIGDTPVRSIALKPSNPNVIYVCSDNIIYKTNDLGKNWEKVITSLALKEEYEEESTDEETEDNQEIYGIIFNCIAIRQEDIYLGTNEGIFYLKNGTKFWQKFNDTGLANSFINFILLAQKDEMLFAATKEGAFRYSHEEGRWQALYEGMTSLEVNYIAFDSEKENFLWLAAEKGIYKTQPVISETDFSELKDKKINFAFKDEPTILEVQDVAIRYAEVHPDKINKWRRDAKFKAILPKVTLGLDYSKSDTYEIYTSSSTNYTVFGPKDATEGWDLTFSWDLSDLIWNESQTSIDVRSKLMVQLRDDILNEVTRYYYERRRLQVALVMNPPHDLPTKIEKELRLEELTAYIDALTGGYFSKKLEMEK